MLVCTLIFIAMVIVMSILPLSYHITNQDYNRNIAALESPEYVEMQNILQEHRSIMNRVAEINEERDKLPFGDSIVSKHLRIIQTDLLSGCTINSMEYEGETDTFNLVVSAKNFDSFLSAKNKLDDREEYRVSFPINITEDEGIWTCELSIAVLTAETQEGMQEGE